MNTQHSKIMRAPSFASAGILISALYGVAVPFSAEAAPGTGGIATDNVTLTSSSSFQTLLSLPLESSTATRLCSVVASLDALNPGGNLPTQNYTFTITSTTHPNPTNPAPDSTAGERVIELRNQPNVDDPNRWQVATNDIFGLPPNVSHTVRLLGIKSAGAPNLVVDDAVLTSMCI